MLHSVLDSVLREHHRRLVGSQPVQRAIGQRFRGTFLQLVGLLGSCATLAVLLGPNERAICGSPEIFMNLKNMESVAALKSTLKRMDVDYVAALNSYSWNQGV